MKYITTKPLVNTIKERCRVCYTCVRECPAKAIRVFGGQAEIITERCIGCGNCVRVCSQKAKVVNSFLPGIQDLFESGEQVIACIAPSFPAEFTQYKPEVLVGILKHMGFAQVLEVATGADIVAAEYKKLLSENSGKQYISSACPAIVSYIEKYYPGIVEYLSPIVSPMIATAMIARHFYGNTARVIFIGPCIAKRKEAWQQKDKAVIDAVFTFSELRAYIESAHIEPIHITPSQFDPPHPGKGLVFPLGGGLLESADLKEDLIHNHVISTEGKSNFVDVIKEFAEGDVTFNFLDILCCKGCIMGPGITSKKTRYNRRTLVSNYARKRITSGSKNDYSFDLSTRFESDDMRLQQPPPSIIQTLLEKMGKTRVEDELNCGACGYETCREHAIAIHKGLAENEMCLPYTIEKLKVTAGKLASSYEELENTQRALIQSEKLASMGQLAAGIAHEINNPLGVVLLYSHIILDNPAIDEKLKEDAVMIAEQADRCRNIVGGLLNFARKNKVFKKTVMINSIISDSLKSVNPPENIRVDYNENATDVSADVDPDQMIQVFVNIITNAFEAMPNGGELLIESSVTDDTIVINIKDNGPGIPTEIIKQIFEPFFTTKQIGKGTGLGLAVTYGIIKMHNGNITVETNHIPENGPTGTCFTITLPVLHQ